MGKEHDLFQTLSRYLQAVDMEMEQILSDFAERPRYLKVISQLISEFKHGINV